MLGLIIHARNSVIVANVDVCLVPFIEELLQMLWQGVKAFDSF
jgi:hypothetical protein